MALECCTTPVQPCSAQQSMHLSQMQQVTAISHWIMHAVQRSQAPCSTHSVHFSAATRPDSTLTAVHGRCWVLSVVAGCRTGVTTRWTRSRASACLPTFQSPPATLVVSLHPSAPRAVSAFARASMSERQDQLGLLGAWSCRPHACKGRAEPLVGMRIAEPAPLHALASIPSAPRQAGLRMALGAIPCPSSASRVL